VTVAKYDEEEFHRVSPENQKASGYKPRWEAEPDYGMRSDRPAFGPGAGGPGGPGGPGAAPRPGVPLTGRQALGQGLDGLPIVKPPYGVMAAIDVNKGDLMWQVPHGDTPDNIKNHALLKGMNVPKTGQNGSVGVLVTKTLVIAGDPQFTTQQRGRGAMLRAYDKKTGAEVGAVYVPAPIVGHPMTYSINGRQHIVVGVSGGNYTGEYISFRLPQTAPTTTAGRQ
jgi:quinoprotein glucose dehydrogenase